MVTGPEGRRVTRSYHHFTPQERALTVLTFVENGRDITATQKALCKPWDEAFNVPPPQYAATYAAEWEEVLKATGALHDRKRPGPHRQVSNALAAEAAELLMDGLPVKVLTPGAAPQVERIHFSSFKEALRCLPRLAAILAECDVTPETLLEAMKRARPNLHYGLQRIRINLSPQNLQQRQSLAAEHGNRDPKYWLDVVFVDETKVIILGDHPQDVKVWRRAGGPDADYVIHVGGWGSKPYKICLYAAVNARLGLVAYQFSTGTTSLGHEWPRVKFTGIQDIDWEDVSYMVRWACCMNQTLPSARMMRRAIGSTSAKWFNQYQGSSMRPAATAGPGL